MEFKKDFLLFIRHSFVRKQLIGYIVIVAGYWSFLFSGYFQRQILPLSQSWLAFLLNLGVILLSITYLSAVIGHCQIVEEKTALPFFAKNPKTVAGMLSGKFWFLFTLNACLISSNYWLFVLFVGSFRLYDFAFFSTVYFTTLFAGLVIQAVTFSSSLQSLPSAKNHLPDKFSFKGFILALLISFLVLQTAQFQIQIYLDYLVNEQVAYPLYKMFYSLGIFFLFSVILSVIYLESSYKNFIKRLKTF